MTLPVSEPTGKPGKCVHRSRQTERPGWRPRQVSPRALARDIAESIAARVAEGRPWSFDDYGIADDPDMQAMVQQKLGDDADQEWERYLRAKLEDEYDEGAP